MTIERTFFIAKHEGERTTLRGEALNSRHPILAGADGSAPVRSLVTNTCCSLTSADGEPLATLPGRMREKLSGRSQDGLLFAVALQAGTGLDSGCKGRVVVAADSGSVGTGGPAYPGVGLIGHGDNLRFVVRALHWLAGELTH